MSRKHFKWLVSRENDWKTGLKGYVYDFTVDYNAIAVADILDILQIFVSGMMFFGRNISSVNSLNAFPLKCVSVNNQECKVRPKIININSNEPLFYP